jgi:hypothetical protein
MRFPARKTTTEARPSFLRAGEARGAPWWGPAGACLLALGCGDASTSFGAAGTGGTAAVSTSTSASAMTASSSAESSTAASAVASSSSASSAASTASSSATGGMQCPNKCDPKYAVAVCWVVSCSNYCQANCGKPGVCLGSDASGMGGTCCCNN